MAIVNDLMKALATIMMAMSTMMAVSSTNMFMLWMSMELNMFSFIPLMLNKIHTDEINASINYFLVQAFGSTILLMSSTTLISMHWFTNTAMVLLMMSMLLKLGASPCFHWFPAVMEKITWMNCLLLSLWQKIIPLFFILFVVSPKINNLYTMLVAALNSITGGLMILSQTSMKKIMAYSSITHTGWMLCGPVSGTPCLSVAYFIMYSTIIAPLFIMLSTTNNPMMLDLWSKQKLSMEMMISMLILLLSLGGMPPLTGFVQKFLMVNILLNNSTMLTLTMIAGFLMNLFFYLNISLSMLLNTQNKNMFMLKTVKVPITITVLATSVMTIMMIML